MTSNQNLAHTLLKNAATRLADGEPLAAIWRIFKAVTLIFGDLDHDEVVEGFHFGDHLPVALRRDIAVRWCRR